MLEHLCRATARKKLTLAGILLLIAALITFRYWAGFAALVQGPQDLYTLDVASLEGRYVAARVDIIYDWYAESVRRGDETETPVRREYIIPVGSFSFMGMEVPSDRFDEADAVLDSTLADYQGYGGDGSELTVRGTIRQMDARTLDYYYQVVGYDDLSEADRQRFLPLVLVADEVAGYPVSSLTTGALALAAFTLPSLLLVLSALFGKGPRQPSAYLESLAARAQAPSLEELDAFYDQTIPADSLRLDRRWLLYENAAASWLLSTRDVAWVYAQPVRRTIPNGACHVVVCSKSEPGRMARHLIPLPSQRAAQNVLGRLSAMLPDAVFGYDPRWEPLYRADPERFCRDIRGEQRAASAAPRAPLYDAVRDAPDIFPPRPGAEPQPLEDTNTPATAEPVVEPDAPDSPSAPDAVPDAPDVVLTEPDADNAAPEEPEQPLF